jgi:hypothetical protein
LSEVWKKARTTYEDCDICEREDCEVTICAKDGRVVFLCDTCMRNLAKLFGFKFEEAEENDVSG